jgi:archaetidylinositol phosphate synthase
VSGSIVTPELRARVRGSAEGVARAFGRLGLTPNQLTFIGFGIAVVAAVAAEQQAWLAAGLLVLFGGVFDLFDGALARATGKVSKLGAFYDSVFDRWGEGVVYVGIAWGCIDAGFGLGAVLATAALTSAVMVSYARAKSESLGFTTGSGMANVGLAPREVRLAILSVGLLWTGLAGGVIETLATCPSGSKSCYDVRVISGYGGNDVLAASLGLITILATITTIQRILHVRAQARGG